MKVEELLEAKVIDINPELKRRKRQEELKKEYAGEHKREKERKERVRPKSSDEVANQRLKDPTKHAAEARRLAKLFKPVEENCGMPHGEQEESRIPPTSIEHGRDFGVTFTKGRNIVTEFFPTIEAAKKYEREMIRLGWESNGITNRR